MFYRGFKKIGLMRTVENFDKLVNNGKLQGIVAKLEKLSTLTEDKQKEEITAEIIKEAKEEEIGFPSEKWFSDHIPIGAVFAPL